MNDNSTRAAGGDAAPGTPAFYDTFYGPLFFEPYAIEVAKRINPAHIDTALEIAAGTGRVTRHIRERIPPTAKLIASDFSPEMLDEAKKKLGHLNIEWQQADAQALPFADNSISLVVCCFGYMFVPDKSKAFAEAFRVLKPGAQLIFTTWDAMEKNAASFATTSVIEEYLSTPLPDSYYSATSMHDEAVIKSLLQDAGFSNIKTEKCQLFSVSPTAKQAATILVKGNACYNEIKNTHPEKIEEIITRVEKELTEKFGAAPMVAPISAVICQAGK